MYNDVTDGEVDSVLTVCSGTMEPPVWHVLSVECVALIDSRSVVCILLFVVDLRCLQKNQLITCED